MHDYLTLNVDKYEIKTFTKIRISNSNLAIEKGRHHGLAVNERICHLCKMDTEDEFHFLISCQKLSNIRSKLFNDIAEIIPDFHIMSDKEKFKFIFSTEDVDILKIIVVGVNEMYCERDTFSKI